MATSRKDIQTRFHQAALAAFERHGFKSYRHAEQITGVNYSTIYAIVSRGRVPTRGQVIEWAEGIEEPINNWLELAGYDLISPDLIESPGQAAPRDQLKEALKRMQLSSDGSAEARANAEHIVKQLIEEVYGEE